MAAKKRPARAVWLGTRSYRPIHDLQARLATERADGRCGDFVLLLEHPPVITLGRGAKEQHVLSPLPVLAQQGIDIVPTGRGGDVTFHGPGQLIAYPILDLRPDRCDVRRYVRALAETMILLAREHGVQAGVVDGMVGVWVDREAPSEWAGPEWARKLAKLGAIGVRLTRWVSMHGFAFNLSVDLAHYRAIVPCGIRDHGVTSIADLTGCTPLVRDVALSSAAVLSQGLDLHVARVEDISAAADPWEALMR